MLSDADLLNGAFELPVADDGGLDVDAALSTAAAVALAAVDDAVVGGGDDESALPPAAPHVRGKPPRSLERTQARGICMGCVCVCYGVYAC